MRAPHLQNYTDFSLSELSTLDIRESNSKQMGECLTNQFLHPLSHSNTLLGLPKEPQTPKKEVHNS